jgi:hypothetical protein
MNGVMEDPYSDHLGNLSHGAGFSEFIRFTRGELMQVSKDVGALFPGDAYVCYAYDRGNGYRYRELGDIIIKPGDLRRPTEDELNRQEFKVAIRPLSPSLAYYFLLSTVEPTSGPMGVMFSAMVAGLLLAPFVLGFIYRSIIEGRHLGRKGWAGWLAVYLAGASVIMFVFFLMSSPLGGTQSNGAFGILGWLVMVLVLLIPLCIALVLSDLIQRNRVPYKKNRVLAVACGMGTAQALALLFFPNVTVAMLSSVFCFPSMLVLGPVVLLVILIGRLDRRNRSRSSGSNPPPTQ